MTLGACIVGSQAAAFPPASPTCVPPPRSIARRNRFADNERRGVQTNLTVGSQASLRGKDAESFVSGLVRKARATN